MHSIVPTLLASKRIPYKCLERYKTGPVVTEPPKTRKDWIYLKKASAKEAGGRYVIEEPP